MTSVKQGKLTIIFVAIGLTACIHSGQQNNIKTKNISVDHAKTNTEVVKKDTVVDDHSSFPVDSSFSVKILTVGTFHGDEVWNNASQLKWFGLFNGQKDCYLKQTRIKTVHVNDPVLDENENEKTGWEVQAINNDTCILLIEPLPFLIDRNIHDVRLSKSYIYPGDSLFFKYLGIDYKIFATGGKKKIQEDPEWFDVWNYKLYLTATIKGQVCKSLLVAHPNFDNQMIRIIFTGDIDGDGILDLIIDTSRHYNATSPTIYLSRPADNGEIVVPVGGHTSVGC